MPSMEINSNTTTCFILVLPKENAGLCSPFGWETSRKSGVGSGGGGSRGMREEGRGGGTGGSGGGGCGTGNS